MARERYSIYALPGLSMRWLPVWKRNILVWRKLMGPALLGNVIEPLLYLLALGYGLGMFIGEMDGVDYITFLASGFICASAMNSASFEGLYSVYTRMAVQRTWEAMLAAPLDVEDVLLGELFWAATKSLISCSVILFVAWLLGAVPGDWAIMALPLLFLLGLCFGSMALVVTALSKSYDSFMYYFTLLVTPMFLFSGVFFPLDNLPQSVQWISSILPLTHGVELVRPLMIGEPQSDVWQHILVLCAYIACCFYISLVLFRSRLVR